MIYFKPDHNVVPDRTIHILFLRDKGIPNVILTLFYKYDPPTEFFLPSHPCIPASPQFFSLSSQYQFLFYFCRKLLIISQNTN
jgi:hypothetical protein